ncbi:type IV secretion system protein [Anabaena azotica]|uniref:Type IV secretion system protein n=1 Tax=Anabaena azotica FACHB-119 TaxID=947527 RepID=A0ABR8D9M2_9NOST|nr:type IV secretion system protein [Anabaena azotica]MBD2503905.1 type IV secretion system protein [Anabaena azotica FACHB-119]
MINFYSLLTVTGDTNAEDIVEGAINGSRLVVSSFNQDWQDLATGQSEAYKAVVSVSALVAVVLVAFWSVGWASKLSEEGLNHEIINEIVYPLIVCLMLTINNGELLANTSLAFRNIAVNLNDRVLSITRNGVTLRDAIRTTNMDQAFSIAVQNQLQQCESEPESGVNDQGDQINPRERCREEKINQAKQAAQEYKQKNGLSSYSNSWNPVEIAGQAINSAVQALSWIIFSGLQAAFQYVVQVAFLLNAYTAPIFLALSLFPFGSKPIYAWIAGWVALTLVLICYSILCGIAASSIVNSSNSNPLFLQLVQAILSPILAVAMGAGGGMSVFSVFSSSARLVAGRIFG